MAEALYSRAQIERWQENLLAISNQPRTTFTKKQAVEALIETIETALATRSYDEVASGLKEWGLDISAGSLKQYVTRYRRAHSANASVASRKRSSQVQKKRSDTGAAAQAISNAAAAQREKGMAAQKKGEGAKSSRFVEMDEDL